MPDFPSIGCHAVAQYPSAFEVTFPLVIQRSVDGIEQRFLRPGQARRGWRILLQRLSEADAQTVMAFFRSVKGRASSFRFQDPWTGQWHEPCWFQSDTLPLLHTSDDRFEGELLITAPEG